METSTVSATTTPAAAPVAAAPATEAPAAEQPAAKRAPSLADLRAARRAAAPAPAEKPAESAPTTTDKPADTSAKPDEAKPDEKVPTDIDPAQLAAFTKINRDLRTANDKIKELQAHAEPATKYQQAMKLAAEGKHFDAIRSLGLDFDAAYAEVIGIEQAKKTTDPEVTKLKEELEALKGESAKEREERTAAETVAREQGIASIVNHVTIGPGKDKFPLLSKSPEWVKAALKGADDAYAHAVKHKGGPLTAAEKDKLILAALEVGEEQRAAEAKLYGVDTKPKAEAPAQPPRTITGSVRSGVTTLPPSRARTLEEIRAERRRAAR